MSTDSLHRKSSTQTFLPPVYVITLTEDMDRRNHVEDLRKNAGIPMKIFPAITPRTRDAYPPIYDARYRQWHYGYDLTPGEVGCFLSHRALWELCAQSQDPAWCILEDDVELDPEFSAKLQLALAHVTDWDVLRLMVERYDRKGLPYKKLDDTDTLMHYVRPAMGTAAYLIRPAAAKRLLAFSTRMTEPVDKVLDQYWLHGLRVLVLEPFVVQIRQDLPSAISCRGWDAMRNGKRPLWRRLQRDFRNGRDALAGLLYSLRYFLGLFSHY